MRRPRRFRKNTERSWSEEETMGMVPQSPTRSLRGRRDTGFPESFPGERTTSLPHPDAKIGPDASLTEDDIAINQALVRHRMSLLVDRGHTRSLGTDSILSHAEQNYCPSPSSLNETDRFPTVGKLAIHSLRGAELPPTAEPHSPQDGRHSIGSSGDSSGRASPTSPKDTGKQHKRRRSFLWRLTHK